MQSDRYRVWEEVDEGTFKIVLDGETPPLFHKPVGPLHKTHKAARWWLMSVCDATEETCLAH